MLNYLDIRALRRKTVHPDTERQGPESLGLPAHPPSELIWRTVEIRIK